MALEPVGIKAVIEGLGQYLSGTREMATSTAGVATAAGKVEKATGAARPATDSFGKSLAAVAKIAAGFVLAQGLLQLPSLFGSLTKAASDLTESINAVQVIFGTSSERILEFGKNAAESVGLSQRAFNELATPLGALLKNAGLSIGAVSDRTIELTKRAADMASVFNTDVGDALGAIQAALRGETEPIRRFGITLNEASIQAEAMALGLNEVSVDVNAVRSATVDVEKAQLAYNEALKKHGALALDSREAHDDLRNAQEKLTKARQGDSAELTQGAKLQAAYSLIMKQSSAVQNDFANTAESAANRTRRLQARQENLRAELGQKLLPLQIKWLELQNTLTSVLGAKVVPAIESVVKAITPAATSIGAFVANVGRGLLTLGQQVLPVIGGVIERITELGRLFAVAFSGGSIGGQFSDIERAAFNLGQIIGGLVGNFRDLGQAAGELFHLFQVGLTGGTIGGEFSDAEKAAYEFGTVLREDVIPLVQTMAGFTAALALEITNVVKRVAEFLQSSGLLSAFGAGLLTLAQGFIKFVQIVADVIRPVYEFFRDNSTARTILAVVAAITLLVSGVGTIPIAIVAVITALGFLRQNFQGIVDFINKYVIGAFKTLVDAYLFMPRQFVNVGTEIVSTIVGGIESASNEISGAADRIIGWFRSGFTGWASALYDIGRAIVDGVWKGIEGAKTYFLQKIGEFFGGAVDYVKDKLGIGSPSKEGEYIGEMFALGVQQGIQKGSRGVQQATGNLGSLMSDLRRLWNDPREFEPIWADVQRVTRSAGRNDLAEEFKRAWQELGGWARANQPAVIDARDPQYQAFISEWNRRKDALWQQIETASRTGGSAIGDFNSAIMDGTADYSTSVGGMNKAVDSGTKAIVGTINGFTSAAGKAITALSYAVSQPIQGSPIVGTPGGTGGGGGGGSTPSQSYTHTIAAGYAYGKAPPRVAAAPAPAPSAPAPAPIMVTINGPSTAQMQVLTHQAVNQAFTQAENQSVRQGALIPNGIG